MDYSDKFVVIGRDDEGHIITVAGVVGANYGEIEKVAIETSEKTHLKYEILHDKTLFDVVYHYEDIYQKILGNIEALYNATFTFNKAIINDVEKQENDTENQAEVEEKE